MLERFHLTIEKRPRYGIRVAGDEMNRRICLASIAVDTRLADDELSGAISPDMLDTVGACVSDALEAEQYKINPVSHQNLVVHIAIAIARIRKECYVPMEAAHLEHVRGTREYAVAGTVAGEIELRFDFRNDAELRMNLARHTMPLIVRLRYNMAYTIQAFVNPANPPPRAWAFRPHGSLPSLRTRRVRTMGGFFILRPVLSRRAPKSRNALIAKQARGMCPSGPHQCDGRVDWI